MTEWGLVLSGVPGIHWGAGTYPVDKGGLLYFKRFILMLPLPEPGGRLSQLFT